MDVTTFHPAMFARIAIATALGAFVGFERERVGKPAGVRTHGIVALGSALFTVVSIYGFEGKSDPARIAAQVVTGVGFLGAGTILHLRGSVQLVIGRRFIKPACTPECPHLAPASDASALDRAFLRELPGCETKSSALASRPATLGSAPRECPHANRRVTRHILISARHGRS